ncbi:Uncharacterised protein [Arcanobacterium haemolyticum]|nr:Uncharacterised protein [Arcanobacterium haemolyticum]
MLWDTRWVNLGVARVTEVGTLAMCTPNCRCVTPHCVRGQEEDVTVTTSTKYNRISQVGFNFTSNHVTSNDAACAAIHHDEFNHFVTWIGLNRSSLHLAHKSLVSTDQELLTCLTTSIECTRNLNATERTVIEQAAVFTSEWNALSNTLINNVGGNFSQTVDVRFACAVIATLNRVIEQTVS